MPESYRKPDAQAKPGDGQFVKRGPYGGLYNPAPAKAPVADEGGAKAGKSGHAA